MSKKAKIAIISIVSVVLMVALGVGLYFGLRDKEPEQIPNTPQTTIDSWVENYDYTQENETNQGGYEDRELPPITLKQKK